MPTSELKIFSVTHSLVDYYLSYILLLITICRLSLEIVKYHFIYAFFGWPLSVRIIGWWNSFHLRILLLTSLWIARVLPIIESTTKPENNLSMQNYRSSIYIFFGRQELQETWENGWPTLSLQDGINKKRQTSSLVFWGEVVPDWDIFWQVKYWMGIEARPEIDADRWWIWINTKFYIYRDLTFAFL